MSPPRISILTPVWNPAPDVLRAAIDSVRAQTWADWELCLVDDGSTVPGVAEVLRESAASDRRIRVTTREVNGGIVAASNDALALATGEFVALLDHDDVLEATALERVVAVLDDDVDYVYTDEDQLTPDGGSQRVFRKPPWTIERFRCQMYTGHLSTFRRSLVAELGGFRDGYEGSQDYDLVLRVVERARRIEHVPEVLYHWRQVEASVASDPSAKMYAYESAERAINDHLERTGFPATAESHPYFLGCYRLRPRLTEHPLVSMVIPTRGSTRKLRGLPEVVVLNCVETVLARTDYPAYEVVVVHDTDTPPAVLDRLRGLSPRVRLVAYDHPFNFADKCNVGALEARGDFVLLLNDDTEPIEPAWLSSMVMYATQPGVGCVGARLLFGDGRLQHAGVVFRDAKPYHRYRGFGRRHEGSFADPILPSTIRVVTGACLLVHRDVYEEVGGLSTDFPVNFNDVDFCLKVERTGRRNIYDPTAELYHYESTSRPAVVEPVELQVLWRRWFGEVFWDPWHPQSGAIERLEGAGLPYHELQWDMG